MNLFKGISKYDKDYPQNYITLYMWWYSVKSVARIVRVSNIVTKAIGFQFTRSRKLIELDITYLCNLKCNNCNRSCSQAPQNLNMPLQTVVDFVNESIKKTSNWNRIRVLGGEPTLHPQFLSIINELLRYKEHNPVCIVEVVTNGHGSKVQEALRKLPESISIDNSYKLNSDQPTFIPFNLAAIDDPKFIFSDYRNGCSIIRDCGIGFTSTGYYPCAIAGGIDRITGQSIGRTTIPEDSDDMRDILDCACRLCGRFKEDFVPEKLRTKTIETSMSSTWKKLYDNWNQRNKQDN